MQLKKCASIELPQSKIFLNLQSHLTIIKHIKMKKTLLAAVLFLGFTAAIFALAEGRCMKCKKQVEIQNMEEITLSGEVAAKAQISSTEFIYLLWTDHGHGSISLPTTADLAIGAHATLKVEVRGWDPNSKEPIEASYEGIGGTPDIYSPASTF